jgi:hypothetical protein
MTVINHNQYKGIIEDTADVRNFASAVCLAVKQNLVPTVLFKHLTTLSLSITPNWPLSNFLPFLLASPILYSLELSCFEFSRADSKFQDAMTSLLENCPLLNSLTLDLDNLPSNKPPLFSKDTIHTALRSLDTSCHSQPIHLYFPAFPCLQELTIRAPEDADGYEISDYQLDFLALLHFKVQTAAENISLEFFDYISSAHSLVSLSMQYINGPPFTETIEKTLIKVKQICSPASFHELSIHYSADPFGTPMDEYFLENEDDYVPFPVPKLRQHLGLFPLRRLIIDVELPFTRLHDHFLLTVGETWPTLETLHLIAGNGMRIPVSASTRGVIRLLECCSQLESLKIPFFHPAEIDLDIPPTSTYPQLTTLGMVKLDNSSQNSFANYVRGMMPSIIRVSIQTDSVMLSHREINVEDLAKSVSTFTFYFPL